VAEPARRPATIAGLPAGLPAGLLDRTLISSMER